MHQRKSTESDTNNSIGHHRDKFGSDLGMTGSLRHVIAVLSLTQWISLPDIQDRRLFTIYPVRGVLRVTGRPSRIDYPSERYIQ